MPVPGPRPAAPTVAIKLRGTNLQPAEVEDTQYYMNPWGFYDMHGSAAEGVQDYYGPYTTELQGPATGTERVLRGGGLTLSAAETRSAARASFVANARLSTFGLRIVQRIREID